MQKMYHGKKVFPSPRVRPTAETRQEKAQHDATLYGKKFLVLVFGGKPVVVSMQGIKKLIRQHRFAKGFTAEKAEKCALYVAIPDNSKKQMPCS